MKTFHLIIVASALLILANCHEPQTNKPKQKRISSRFTNSFRRIPDELDGCACFFSKNHKKFDEGEYVFAAGFDSLSFVSINNRLVRLILISTDREPGSFGDYDHTEVYKGGGYKIIVKIKYIKSTGEETWWNNGTITILNKSGRKKTIKFVGECGC